MLLVCAVGFAATLDVTHSDFKIVFVPWKWPLTEAPVNLKSTLRPPDLWIVVILDGEFAVNVAIHFFI